MASAKITIDGQVVVDGSIDEWVRRSPQEATKFLSPAEKPSDAGMVALLVVLGLAVSRQRPIQVELTHTGNDFDLSVKYRATRQRPASSHGVLEHLNIKHPQEGTS